MGFTGVYCSPKRLTPALHLFGVSGMVLREAVRVNLRMEREDFLSALKSGVGTAIRTCLSGRATSGVFIWEGVCGAIGVDGIEKGEGKGRASDEELGETVRKGELK